MNLFEKYNLISEQGPPPGGNPMAAMMGMMGGGQQGPPPSTEDQLFERVRNYPKINLIIQSLQQKGVSDSRILDEIYKKFKPEFVYFAKEIIQQANKPKPPAGPGGPGGMPGMPGGMPGGAGPVAEQFGGLNNRIHPFHEDFLDQIKGLIRNADGTVDFDSDFVPSKRVPKRVPPLAPRAPIHNNYGTGSTTNQVDPLRRFDKGDTTPTAIRRLIRQKNRERLANIRKNR